jgi:hypothetical protein
MRAMKRTLFIGVAAIVVGLTGTMAHASPLREDVEGMGPINEVIAQGGSKRPEVVVPPPSVARDCRFYRQAFKPSFLYGGSTAYDIDTSRLCSNLDNP